jgi:hypothetical protein
VFDKLEIGRVSDVEGADEILREEMTDALVEALFDIELVEVESVWKAQQSIVNEEFIFVGSKISEVRSCLVAIHEEVQSQRNEEEQLRRRTIRQKLCVELKSTRTHRRCLSDMI